MLASCISVLLIAFATAAPASDVVVGYGDMRPSATQAFKPPCETPSPEQVLPGETYPSNQGSGKYPSNGESNHYPDSGYPSTGAQPGSETQPKKEHKRKPAYRK